MAQRERKIRIDIDGNADNFIENLKREVGELGEAFSDLYKDQNLPITEQIKLLKTEFREVLKGFDDIEKGYAKAFSDEYIVNYKRSLEDLERKEEDRRKKLQNDAQQARRERQQSYERGVQGVTGGAGNIVGSAIQGAGGFMTSGSPGGLVSGLFGAGGGILGAGISAGTGALTGLLGPLTGALGPLIKGIGGFMGKVLPIALGAFGLVAGKGVMEALKIDTAQSRLQALTGDPGISLDSINAATNAAIDRKRKEMDKALRASEGAYTDLRSKEFPGETAIDKQRRLDREVWGKVDKTDRPTNFLGGESTVAKKEAFAAASTARIRDEIAALERARMIQTQFSALGIQASKAMEMMATQASITGLGGNIQARTLQNLQVERAFGIQPGGLAQFENLTRFGEGESAGVSFERLRKEIIALKDVSEAGWRMATGDYSSMIKFMEANNKILSMQLAVGERVSNVEATALQTSLMKLGGKFADPDTQIQMAQEIDRSIKSPQNEFVNAYTMRAIQQVGRQAGITFTTADILDIQEQGLMGPQGAEVFGTMLGGLNNLDTETGRLARRAVYGGLDPTSRNRLGNFGGNFGELFRRQVASGRGVQGIDPETLGRAGAFTPESEKLMAQLNDTLGFRLGQIILDKLIPTLEALSVGELTIAAKELTKAMFSLVKIGGNKLMGSEMENSEGTSSGG